MLEKIHELIGREIPEGVKSIQVHSWKFTYKWYIVFLIFLSLGLYTLLEKQSYLKRKKFLPFTVLFLPNIDIRIFLTISNIAWIAIEVLVTSR